MDGKLVTDLPSDDETVGGGGNTSRPSPILRYSDKFEELCGYYMSIGMTYEEYWDGDNCMTKYYREKFQLEQERMNRDLWLQGAYIYEALLDASPVFNPLSVKKKPLPYRENPVPLTERESKRLEELNKQKMMENGREAMRMMMVEFNRQFEEKLEKGGEPNDGD